MVANAANGEKTVTDLGKWAQDLCVKKHSI